MVLTVVAALNANWLVFLCSVPMALYHMQTLATRSYRVYALTRQEYQKTQEDVVRRLRVKAAYYGVLLALLAIVVLMNSANMVAYHLVGRILWVQEKLQL